MSVFASKCMGEYHAGTAALCILAGGIPGFRIELLLLLSPNVALWWCFCSSVLWFILGTTASSSDFGAMASVRLIVSSSTGAMHHFLLD